MKTEERVRAKDTGLSRRSVLAASPALVAASLIGQKAIAEPTDPVLPLYETWTKARQEWLAHSQLPDNGNFDSPAMLDAEAREHEAFFSMLDVTPTTMAGIAALAHVLWDVDGPCSAASSPDYDKECEYPNAKLLRAIWRGATGRQDEIAGLTVGRG